MNTPLTKYIPDLYEALDVALRRARDRGEHQIIAAGSSGIAGRGFARQQIIRAMENCLRGPAHINASGEVLDYCELVGPDKKALVGVTLHCDAILFKILPGKTSCL